MSAAVSISSPHGPAMHHQQSSPPSASLSSHHFTQTQQHQQQHQQQQLHRIRSNSTLRLHHLQHQSHNQTRHDTHRDNSSSNSGSSSSSHTSSSTTPSLQDILLDRAGGVYSLELFAEFLQSQFCYENLAFWLASYQYKIFAQSIYSSIRESSPQFNLHQDSLQFLTQAQTRLFSDLQSDMLVILETFILPDSPYELNLTDMIRSKFLKAVAEGDYRPQILEPAEDAITDLIKSSSYPLFLENASKRDPSASSSSSGSNFTHDSRDRDRSSWQLKARDHFKQVSRALKKHTP